jgi:hypothetical protein
VDDPGGKLSGMAMVMSMAREMEIAMERARERRGNQVQMRTSGSRSPRKEKMPDEKCPPG